MFPRLVDAPGGSTVDVFGPDGVHEARIELPVELPVSGLDEPIVTVSGRSMLAVVKDELDVPYVVRFRLERR